jgi:hypothetical protein
MMFGASALAGGLITYVATRWLLDKRPMFTDDADGPDALK